ncbi:DEAD/DEAH box helicase family protein [Roseburia inulinivorans]|uniref:Type I restriction enzyme EcoKI subunit R n=1 Tax=Roseburia inulinivorans TaxID=360807 RepID=A0A173WFP1_9FIRM|nr:DEAD/DEAH box helicase family protein [Roseburia inulinivorans]CUN38303.1 type I restriction enzyme EcoKI subunit R [Roseburia inulinivorans]
MAELNTAEELDDINELEYGTDALTGGQDKRMYLYYQLLNSLKRADSVDIVVSFLMESGVRMLLGELDNALKRGAKIRILTGNYLGITQPSALYLIKHKLGEQVDLRFYNEKNRSFHPKSYMFHYKDYSTIYIGSSNISKSALTSGIEWNYRFSSKTDSHNYEKFYNTFLDLFEHHSIVIDDDELKRYSKNWHRPAVSKDLDRYDLQDDETTNNLALFEPRGAQIEALCALENTRAEGAGRALVQAATGVGKTYLAAFDSKDYERVLFVAHREEILKQAAQSFKNVRNSDDYGFFDGESKCTDKSMIFASVATLGRSEYLNNKYFASDYFNYIVIDEFHHAVNDQYQRIVNYFKPQFLLGLTATPERMDGRNIYEICDYNVPYEISLKEAINKGMLVPFHYYGIFDDTDYSKLHIVRGRYDEKELNETYIGNVHRYELIYKYYCKYGSRQALGFCCSKEHAREMAREFSSRGIPSVAVFSDASGEYTEKRNVAIQKLKNGEIRAIFSVDMFNEGVDITSVDMVMFLRPTESPIVFLQQLGRGLRKCRGKEFLTVLDFIGNYEKAGRVRFLLEGKSDMYREGCHLSDTLRFPDDCMVDFDLKLIDLFAEMDRKHLKLKDQVINEYFRVKDLLGKRPTRLDLFTYMDDNIYETAITHSKDNPFKRYLEFLNDLGELSQIEVEFYKGIGREFISLLENTNMSKVYKMPVLMAFYNNSDVLMEVSEKQLLSSWKEFFSTGTNWKDFDKNMTLQKYKDISDKDHLKKILAMPVHFLLESGKGFFVKNDDVALGLREELRPLIDNPVMIRQMKDVIDYRTMDYYQRRYRERQNE